MDNETRLSPLQRRSATFYDCRTGKWNHEYLRISAVYRCLSRYGMDRQTATRRLAERGVEKPARLVELWMRGPLRHLSAT